VIESYLSRLDAELRVPRRSRARILAEVRDHLEEGGAVEAFGDPAELAAQFHEQLASAGARRAGAHTALLMVLLAAGLAAAAFPVGIVMFFAAQLAAVSGGLGFARWLRYRGGVPPDRLADIYRANGLTVACVAAVAVAQSGVIGAVLFAASVATAISIARARARARVVPAQAPTEDAVDDIAAILPLGPVRRLGSALRARPWLAAVGFAAACGLALALQHALVEGGIELGWRQLLAALVIASIEATAVIVCFAAFGRMLGVRRPDRV
jgi:hypothetical protein